MPEKCIIYDFYKFKKKLEDQKLKERLKNLDELVKLWKQYDRSETKRMDELCKKYGITLKGDII